MAEHHELRAAMAAIVADVEVDPRFLRRLGRKGIHPVYWWALGILVAALAMGGCLGLGAELSR